MLRLLTVALVVSACIPAHSDAQSTSDTVTVVRAALAHVDSAGREIPSRVRELCVFSYGTSVAPDGLDAPAYGVTTLSESVVSEAASRVAADLDLEVAPSCDSAGFRLIQDPEVVTVTVTGVHFSAADSAAVGVWYYPDDYRSFGWHCWVTRDATGTWTRSSSCMAARGQR